MPITLPSYVAPNELIQSAWGNASVDALSELDDEKLDLTGGTMTGNLTVNAALTVAGLISATGAGNGLALPVGEPSGPGRAPRKDYVDTQDALRLALTGGTLTGQLFINRTAVEHCVLIEQDPSGGHGSVLRADGQLQTSITGTGGSTISTQNIVCGRGGTPANDTGVYIEFRSDPSSSANPQGTTRGSITVNGGGGGNVAYNTTSDPRIKRVDGPADDAAVIVQGLGALAFVGRWLDDDGHPRGTPEVMLSSHDVEDHAPWAVTGERGAVDGDGRMVLQQVNFPALVPVLVAALGNALDRITVLEGG